MKNLRSCNGSLKFSLLEFIVSNLRLQLMYYYFCVIESNNWRHWFIMKFPSGQAESLLTISLLSLFNPIANALTPILSLNSNHMCFTIYCLSYFFSRINNITCRRFSLGFIRKTKQNKTKQNKTKQKHKIWPQSKL